MGVFDLISPEFRDPADCIVRVDDQEIAELYPFLREVTAEAFRDDASTAKLTFETQRDEHGRWSVQDRGILAPWKRIVIEITFGQRNEELFRGYIRDVLADYPAEPGSATVTVNCQDESLALDREHVRKPWGVKAPTTDAAIVHEILTNHQLSLVKDAPASPGLSNLVLNQDSTDIQFLQDRAKANGYELYFRRGELYFGPMRLEAKPQKTILVYAGPDTNCIALSVHSDGHRPNKVAMDLAPSEGSEIKHKDVIPKLQLLGTESAAAGGAGLKDFTWIMSGAGSFDEDELTARAQQKVDDLSMRVSADGELDGSLYGAVLLPGIPVAVDGAGDWLSGVYYVDRVTHVLSLDGYRQQIRLLRNAYGDNAGGGPVDRILGIR
jgi:phage protein D